MELWTPISILKKMDDKVIPIIQNHLSESEENVIKALKDYKRCVETLKESNSHIGIYDLQKRFEKAIRISVLDWYEAKFSKFAEKVRIPKGMDRYDLLRFYVELMTDVNKLLSQGIAKWHPDFWLIANYGVYMPVIYDELHKVVQNDVEGVCSFILQQYGDNEVLHRILHFSDEKEQFIAKAFFSLYTETKTFVETQNNIFIEKPQRYKHLDEYYTWFRPILVIWLGFAVIQGSEMITMCVNMDTVTKEHVHEKTSSSALETAAVMYKMIHFWQKLDWPDTAEKFIVISFLIEVICYFTVLYAKRKYEKLALEGYFDTEDRFNISERLCTALNNIEYVKDFLDTIPEEIEYNKLIEELERDCGSAPELNAFRHRLKNSFHLAHHNVDTVFGTILMGVSERLRPEITEVVFQTVDILRKTDHSLHEHEQINKAVDPFLSYLNRNIVTVSQSLISLNFARVLLLFWNLACEEVLTVTSIIHMKNELEEGKFYTRVLSLITVLQKYFDHDDEGLDEEEMDCPAFRNLWRGILLFTLSTKDVIGQYFALRGAEQFSAKMTKEKAPYGTLVVKMEYEKGKLCINVISASKLIPSDDSCSVWTLLCKKRPPHNDPFVVMEMQPRQMFSDPKMSKTEVAWRTVNPVFNAKIYWDIPPEEAYRERASVVFTVHDYNYMGHNDFLGEAVVPFSMVPGVAPIPVPQPMHLKLRVAEHCQALHVLKHRKWDSEAQEFYERQAKRAVIS